MKWIGLTGGIATGKSSVTKVLRTLGYTVIDADEVAHAVTAVGEPAVPLIVCAFGLVVQKPDGSLDRQKLGQIVFGRPEEIKKLEQIVHPFIIAKVASERKKLESAGVPVAFYDVPLLFEKNMESLFDAVILVWATEEQQRRRLLTRNGLTPEQIEARLKSQWPITVKKSKTPYVIDNSKDEAFLKLEIARVLAELKLK
jgi:dephospho-CoA kinase